LDDKKARDLMTPAVVTVSPRASVIEAAKLMLDNRLSGLPVVDDGGLLIGMITEGDLLRRVEIGTASPAEWPVSPEALRHFRKAHGQRVADAMSDKVASVLENTPLAEIARLMQLMGLKRVPVTDHGSVVGVISRADLLRVLISKAEAHRDGAAGASDL
jgi:CBS domain-containing protein